MRSTVFLILLALTVGYSLLSYAGVTQPEWNAVVLVLCSLSLLYWIPVRSSAFAPPPSHGLSVLVAAFVAYIAIQLTPLPVSWIAVLSPAKAELISALSPEGLSGWTPLSVSPTLTFIHLFRILAYLLVFFLIRDLTFHQTDRTWMIAVPLLLFASGEAALGLTQSFGTGQPATGTFVNQDHFSGLLELILPFPLMLALNVLRSVRKQLNESLGKATLVCVLLACSAEILLAMLYSGSRMSLPVTGVSIIVMTALFFGSSARGKAGRMTSLLAAVAAIGFVLLSVPLALIQRYSPGLTQEGRLAIWKETAVLIRHYPVFGCGLGTFVSAIQKYRTSLPLNLVDYAHNDYLQLLAEMGVVGFAIVLAILLISFRILFRSAQEELGQTRRALAIASAASLSGIAVHSVVEFHFYIPATMLVVAWIAGIASGIHAAAKPIPRQ